MVRTVLTASGCIVYDGPVAEIKKDLTVRPLTDNKDYGGFPAPPFKVFRMANKTGGICVPKFYAQTKFGCPDEDKRVAPKRCSIAFTGVLRDTTHQNAAVDSAIKASSGLLSLPCGYGKTTCALAIAARLGYRTMIIVHKSFLADQWRERIGQFCPGATIGVVQGPKIDVEADFVIAMLQSLSQKDYSTDDFSSIGTCIVDECHHICARSFSRALFKLNPRHLFGLSATPDRKDGLRKVMEFFMGPCFFQVERKNQENVEVFTLPFTHEMYKEGPPLTRQGKVCLANMITMLVELKDRNAFLIEWIKEASKGTRRLLVLTDRRWHCEYLHQAFPKTSGLYMGGMKQRDLEASSEQKIIFATFAQAHEGLDIPALDTVLLASPKSDITQSIGRIMRETKGKKNPPFIYDVRDDWNMLVSMFYKRMKVYRAGGFKIHGTKEKSSSSQDRDTVVPQGFAFNF